MPLRLPQRPALTRLGRGAVLAVLLAGFLSMHGFFAVSSPAHSTTAATSGMQTAADGHGTSAGDALGVGAVAGHTSAALPGPGSGGHAPLEHHDVLMGCVVALVGGAALGVLALLLLTLYRPTHDGSARRAPGSGLPLLDVVRRSLPGLPRIALCVIRV